MKEAGYTATEALAALAILGLAVGGLTSAMGVLGHGQLAATKRISEAQARRVAQDELSRLLSRAGPFRADRPDFVGSSTGFRFGCGARQCAMRATPGALEIDDAAGRTRRVPLPTLKSLTFVYVGSGGDEASWPPPRGGAPPVDALRALVLTDGVGGEAVGVAPVWRRQPADCEFDTVIQDCRGVAP